MPRCGELDDVFWDKIGLTLLGKDETEPYYALGTSDGKILLEIFQTTIARTANVARLYQMAFRLPSRKDLGSILLRLVEHQVQLTGASNHGRIRRIAAWL